MHWNPLEYFGVYPLRDSYHSPKLYEILTYEYALFGAYTMRPFLPQRATFAIDVLVEQRSAALIYQQLKPEALIDDYYADTHQFYVLKDSKIFLNVISLNEDWVTKALKAASLNLDPNTSEPTVPFEWLILSKMSYGRRQDFMDCARLIARANEKQIAKTKELLEHWLPNSLPELRKLYKVGKVELEKSSNNSKYRNLKTSYTPWHHLSASLLRHLDDDWTNPFSRAEELYTPKDWPEQMVS